MKLRLPVAYKIEDEWMWYLSGTKPKWTRGFNMYGSVAGAIINQGFGENFIKNGKQYYGEIVKGIIGHNGIDWWSPFGTTIFAVQDGIIGWVNDPKTVDYNDGYGGYVEILFTSGDKHYRYIYGHLETVNVKRGQQIAGGQVIGTGDNTGKYTTGSHLHTGLMALDTQGNRLDTDNGYLGYVDESSHYITELKAKPLTYAEEMYWHERVTGRGYRGKYGIYNWVVAKRELGIPKFTISRDEYFKFANQHKEQ